MGKPDLLQERLSLTRLVYDSDHGTALRRFLRYLTVGHPGECPISIIGIPCRKGSARFYKSYGGNIYGCVWRHGALDRVGRGCAQ
jgi:hypothetical protein